jgi:hypothetical protein
MKKIFNFTIQRSGTKSFFNYCKSINLLSLHNIPQKNFNFHHYNIQVICEKIINKEFNEMVLFNYYKDNFISYYDSFSDMPLPLIFNYIIENYKNDIFLLISRDQTKLVNSLKIHHKKTQGVIDSNLDRLFYYQHLNFTGDLSSLTEKDFLECYTNYYSKVFHQCLKHNVNLYLLNLDDLTLSIKLDLILNTSKCGVFGKYL